MAVLNSSISPRSLSAISWFCRRSCWSLPTYATLFCKSSALLSWDHTRWNRRRKDKQFQEDQRKNGKGKINANLSYREKICTLVLVWSDPDSTRLARVLKPELMIIRRAQSAEVKLDRQLPCKGQLHSDNSQLCSSFNWATQDKALFLICRRHMAWEGRVHGWSQARLIYLFSQKDDWI